MTNGGLAGRRNELEEQFFTARDQQLLQALREEAAAKARKEALSEASGIADHALLDQLHELDVCHETVAALSLVPLIAVAWADRSVDAKERDAVLAAAEQTGLEQGHPGYRMLQRWLEKEPDVRLLDIWKAYVAELSQSLDAASSRVLKERLLGRARAVAEASGGILGFGNKVSKPEEAVLSELEQAFG
jgi:hypothetical protein